MPKSSVRNFPAGFARKLPGQLTLGLVWGGISGAMIGAGLSMTIGLFVNNSAAQLIFAVITIFAFFGAIFGQIMARLLAGNSGLESHVHESFHASANKGLLTDLYEHKALKTGQKEKFILNQHVMAKVNTVRYAGTTLPRYHSDARVFELIVAAAHKTAVIRERPGSRQA